MNGPPWLEQEAVPAEVGTCTPVSRFCKCRRSTLPLRSVDRTMAQLRDALQVATECGQEPPGSEADVLTYRCPDCKKIARITMGMLGLVVL